MYKSVHKVAFVISGILLILAVSSAYATYLEGNTAKNNAEESLAEFEKLILKTETTEPQYATAIPIPYERMDAVERVEAADTKVQQISIEPIAKVQIENVGLNASVLPEWSYELLDISVNKFSGPEPNEPGNFIVIGHNYINKSHFGSLHLVELGDLINLTDLSGRTLSYEVYEVLIIKPDEVEKLATESELTLTLVTCDDNNDYRLVVKSKVLHN